MTGYFAGGSREGLERARQTQCFSRIIHLVKLNPNCRMNYSIIFTEISFSPETSILNYFVNFPLNIITYYVNNQFKHTHVLSASGSLL